MGRGSLFRDSAKLKQFTTHGLQVRAIGYAYMDKIRNSKTMLKQWFVTMLLTDQAYGLYVLFKLNAVIIRT